MTDPFELTPDTHPDTASRWQAAFDRAQAAELMIRPGLFGTRLWTVTSKSRPDLVYATDGNVCGCLACEHGDPVCQHRALVRMIEGRLPEVIPANVVQFPQRTADDRLPAA